MSKDYEKICKLQEKEIERLKKENKDLEQVKRFMLDADIVKLNVRLKEAEKWVKNYENKFEYQKEVIENLKQQLQECKNNE